MDYCRPTFDVETRIVDAIHPLLGHGDLNSNAVPNGIVSTVTLIC